MRRYLPLPSSMGLCALLLCLCAPLQAAAPATQPASMQPAPIVELRGSAAEMGQQYGQQLDAPITLLHEKYLKVFLGSPTQRFIAIAAAKAFEEKFSPEHLAELNAMAQQVGMNSEEAALAQCFLDLTPMSA